MVQSDSTRKPALGQETQLGNNKFVDLHQCLLAIINLTSALELIGATLWGFSSEMRRACAEKRFLVEKKAKSQLHTSFGMSCMMLAAPVASSQLELESSASI